MEGHACCKRKSGKGREDWAAVDTADLGGGGHADLGDKCVIKKAENLLLLHLLRWGVFGRRRDRWAFPELWASKGGSMGGVAEHSTGRQRQSHGYVSHSQAVGENKQVIVPLNRHQGSRPPQEKKPRLEVQNHCAKRKEKDGGDRNKEGKQRQSE